MNEKAIYAVNMAGNRVAKLELSEGADRLDAELFVLRNGVPGAHSISDGDNATDELIAFYEAKGYSKEVASKMATDGDPYVPEVLVERQAPSRNAAPARESGTRPARSGSPVELRETPRLTSQKRYGRIDYGNGRVVGAELNERNEIVKILGR